ncbi:hypothetical protein [Natrinema halophilum]|uniref:Uncharacterized protein n=1 Tax=Natrinema halophilum TaxID=1699371 RepID=A0A7D5L379_9EURY|nr:hypothetical protein [Natrinema halophilum]QLG48025.1 hypothetical protein HYG82_03785 [Natrinema halophilum]
MTVSRELAPALLGGGQFVSAGIIAAVVVSLALVVGFFVFLAFNPVQ